MPYKVRKVREDGDKPYFIFNQNGKVVGTSDTKEKAERSAMYRITAERAKKQLLTPKSFT